VAVTESGSERSVLVNVLRQNQWANLTTNDARAAIDPAMLDAEALEQAGVAAPDTDGWSWWESGAAESDRER
jgi:hypothetical protein